jgi:hypothetical protein
MEGKDHSWLIDMMITIMHSKSWNDPLEAFISEKCIMFDNFQEEMKHEYTTVHIEFKNLVDNLLAAHLLEVDISPEDFEQQCIDSGLVEDPRLQSVVNQLMAAADFMTFKDMMVARHISMQTQAETNYKELTISPEEQLARDAQMAAMLQGAEHQPLPPGSTAAPTAVQQNYYTPPPVAPPINSVAPPTNPSMAQENAFAAGGGFYGRAAISSSSRAPPSKEKADAIRKALCGALRPR